MAIILLYIYLISNITTSISFVQPPIKLTNVTPFQKVQNIDQLSDSKIEMILYLSALRYETNFILYEQHIFGETQDINVDDIKCVCTEY